MTGPTSEAARIVGDRIRQERLRLGLSQEDVANLAGMNVSNYGKIERGIGNPVLHTIVRLAVVVGIDPSVLVKGIGVDELPTSRQTFSAADYIREKSQRQSSR